jgi:hypothetical protein
MRLTSSSTISSLFVLSEAAATCPLVLSTVKYKSRQSWPRYNSPGHEIAGCEFNMYLNNVEPERAVEMIKLARACGHDSFLSISLLILSGAPLRSCTLERRHSEAILFASHSSSPRINTAAELRTENRLEENARKSRGRLSHLGRFLFHRTGAQPECRACDILKRAYWIQQ